MFKRGQCNPIICIQTLYCPWFTFRWPMEVCVDRIPFKNIYKYNFSVKFFITFSGSEVQFQCSDKYLKYFANYKNEIFRPSDTIWSDKYIVHPVQFSSNPKLISISTMCCIRYVLNNHVIGSVTLYFMKQAAPNDRSALGVRKIFMIHIDLTFERGVVYNGLNFSQIIVNSQNIKNTIWRHWRMTKNRQKRWERTGNSKRRSTEGKIYLYKGFSLKLSPAHLSWRG